MRPHVPIFVSALALLAAACSEDSVPPDYLGAIDAGATYQDPYAPLSDAGAATDADASADAGLIAPLGATPKACPGSLASSYPYADIGAGAAFAGGQLFVAVGDGVQRLATDGAGCPVMSSAALFATDLAPVRSVALSGDRLWAAGSRQVTSGGGTTSIGALVAYDSLGNAVTECQGTGVALSIAADAGGGVVAVTGGSTVSFFAEAAAGCSVRTDSVAPLTLSADQMLSVSPLLAISELSAELYLGAFSPSAALIEPATRPDDASTTVKIDMPFAPTTGLLSLDAMLAIEGADGTPRLLVADDVAGVIVEFETSPTLSPIATFAMRRGHLVRGFAADPSDPTRVLAVEIAPAGPTSVVDFDLLTLTQ